MSINPLNILEKIATATFDNTYAYGAVSGLYLRHLVQYAHKTEIPITITAPVCMIVHRTFATMANFLERHKNTIDEAIATYTLPTISLTFLGGFMTSDPSALRLSLLFGSTVTGFLALCTPAPAAIRKAAPMATILHVFQKTILRVLPETTKAGLSYLGMGLVHAFVIKSLKDPQHQINFCTAFGALTLGGFATYDITQYFNAQKQEESSSLDVPLSSSSSDKDSAENLSEQYQTLRDAYADKDRSQVDSASDNSSSHTHNSIESRVRKMVSHENNELRRALGLPPLSSYMSTI